MRCGVTSAPVGRSRSRATTATWRCSVAAMEGQPRATAPLHVLDEVAEVLRAILREAGIDVRDFLAAR